MFKEGFVICENEIKNSILRENKNVFLDYTFLDSKSLLKGLTFDIKKEGLLAYSLYSKIKPEIVKTYFEYLPYISLFDRVVGDSKINFLKSIYNWLKDKGFLIIDKDFIPYLKKRAVSFVGYDSDDKNILFLQNILKDNDVEFETISSSENQENNKHIVYHFDTLLDESRYVFNEIKKLLDSGVSINNIKICNYSDAYYHTFYRLSSYYNIPINFDAEKNILSTSIVKTLFSELDNKENNNICDVMDKLNNTNPFFKSIMNIVNSYKLKNYSLSDIKDILKMEIKNIKYDSVRYENGIILSNLYAPNYTSEDHVFVLGFNQNVLPRIFVDNAYLSDKTLQKMGLNTSLDAIRLDEKVVLHNLNLDVNYHISYKLSSPFESFLKSEFLNKYKYEDIEGIVDDNISEREDKIIYGESLDNFYKYNDKDRYYNNVYDVNYLGYKNDYKGIEDETKKKIIPDVIKLSYSTINIYAKCAFRYLMEKILYLSEFDHTMNTNCGVYAHKILEEYYKHPEYTYDELKQIALDDFVETRKKEQTRGNKDACTTISTKEKFFFNLMDCFVKETIDFNKEHEEKAGFSKALTEYKVNIKYDNDKLVFEGAIDKILIKNKKDKKYVAIVDYKTGNTKYDRKNIDYGFNMQLPSYVYMAKQDKKTFNDPVVLGMYLQKIGPSNKDEYRLQGFTNISNDYWRELDDLEENSSSEYICSLSTKKDGELAKKKTNLDEDELNYLARVVEKNLKNTYELIRVGSFEINPKFDGNTNLSCDYCKYKDVCYRTHEKIEIGKEDGDDNGMDRGTEDCD